MLSGFKNLSLGQSELPRPNVSSALVSLESKIGKPQKTKALPGPLPTPLSYKVLIERADQFSVYDLRIGYSDIIPKLRQIIASNPIMAENHQLSEMEQNANAKIGMLFGLQIYKQLDLGISENAFQAKVVYSFISGNFFTDSLKWDEKTLESGHRMVMSVFDKCPDPEFRKLNPLYFDIWSNWARKASYILPGELRVMFDSDSHVANDEIRESATKTLSWAIPTYSVVEKMVELSNGPILELCAGSGYWARLLKHLGADITAVDNFAELKTAQFFDVVKADALQYLRKNKGCPKSALFLCWPRSEDGIVPGILQFYKGSTILYVGEIGGGCTFDILAWHEKNSNVWEIVLTMEIPNWLGIYDKFWCLKRKI